MALTAWLMYGLATPVLAKPLFKAPSLVYPTGPRPQVVAIGDFNRDGRPDIATVNTGYSDGHSSISILTGLGDAEFETGTDLVTGRSASSLAVTDLDSDGNEDLAVAHGGFAPGDQGTISIFNGNGDGTFAVATDLKIGCFRKMVFADFDLDGNLDLATAGCDTLAVRLGNGDGSLGSPTLHASIYSPSGLVAADLNADGHLDVAVTVSGADSNEEDSYPVAVWLGDGEGSFGAAAWFGAATHPTSIVTADFDGDGQQDLAFTNEGDSRPTLGVLSGTGDGTFGAQRHYRVDHTPRWIATADLNGDGRVDVATANSGDDPDFNSDNVSVLLGNGDGTFAPARHYQVGEDPYSVAIADLDGDGVLDLATANSSSSTVSVILGNGDGSFGTRDVSPLTNPESIAIADFDHDGKPDLAVAGAYPDTFAVFAGMGGGRFDAPRRSFIGRRSHLAVADVDLDGHIDVVATGSASSVLLGNGDGSFAPAVDFDATGGKAVAVADFNADGKPDVAVTFPGNYPEWIGSVWVLMGDGDGTFSPRTAFGAGIDPHSIAAADLDGDSRLDLVVGDYFGVVVLLGNGDGNFGPATAFGTRVARTVAIADLNGDGRPDLVTGGYTTCSVLLGNGDGTFASGADLDLGEDAASVVVADFDADGRLDVAGANDGLAGTVTARLGRGDGTFGPRAVFGIGPWPNGLVCADIDLNGRPDLLAPSGSKSISVLLATGDALVPALLSAAIADAASDRVVLRWHGEDAANLSASVHRRTASTEWQLLGSPVVEGADLLRYEDREVVPGERYGYRLGYLEDGALVFSLETWVDVPALALFSLAGFRPNPSVGATTIAFSLGDDSPAVFEVIDVAGRRILRRELRTPRAGPQSVVLEGALAPGVYLLRLEQGGRIIRARGVAIR